MTRNDEESDGKDRLLDRRSVLSLTGAAAAAVAGVGTASGAATPSKYMLLDTTDATGPCDYVVEATEAIEVVPTDANTVTATSDTRVAGTVDRGYVALRYDGWFSTMEIDGRAYVRFGDAAKQRFPDTTRVVAVSSPTEVDYEFTATGPIERIQDGSRMAAETNNDSISENDDGTYTASGYTGNGYGDSFRVEGDVTAFTPLEGEFTITVDGQETTAYELTGQEPDTAKQIVVRSPTEVDYEFTTTGAVERIQDGSRLAAESRNDTITENDDGTTTVSGFTGNGYGDSFLFHGDVTAFTPLEGDFTIVVDGEETTAYELTGQEPPEPKRLVVTSPTEVGYQFTAGGEVERVRDGTRLKAEMQNDTVTENDDGSHSVRGFTGNGYGDSFDVTGDISSFSPMEGDFTITYDGEEVSAYELTGQDPPASDGPAIGGGEGYGNAVPESAADVVASTKAELNDALLSASSGDVVYVDGDARIDMGDSAFTVPSGVTLASDRGVDGSSGALLQTSDYPRGMFRPQDDARVTGLRVSGPHRDWVPHNDSTASTGVRVEGMGVEVDNCEVYGWGYAGVLTEDDTHVHHCSVHHCCMEGLGYGVATVGAEKPVAEYNEFYHNRHSVESNANGFVARYNLVKGPAISHVFDQHRPGGSTIEIHNNTVEVVQNEYKDKKVPAVAIRGVPDDVADVHHNWFHNPDRPRDAPNGWTDEAVIQVHTNRWRNVRTANNHYGSDEPASDVGHPR